MRRIAPVLLLLALALGGATASAGAKTSASTTATLPAGFVGMNADGPLLDDPAIDLPGELGRIHALGIGNVRVVFDWAAAQPTDAGTTDLTRLDALVGSTARRGLTVLPIVIHSPAWAADTSAGGDGYAAPPKDPADYAAFLSTLVARYGPRGSFWAENPGVPRHAIRRWQLWNEPNLPRFWARQPFAPSYAKLLKAGAAAVRAADPRAQIYAAGLTNGYHSPAWTALSQLYAAGARGSFDVIAVHPYTGTAARVIETLRRVRAVAARHGDGRIPFALTELSWSSGGGGRKGVTWDTTEAGQATRLKQVFAAVARYRRSMRISAAYWYTWLSPTPDPKQGWEYFAGLNRVQGTRVVAKPALVALRTTIRRLTARTP
jgi:hypothetical protein